MPVDCGIERQVVENVYLGQVNDYRVQVCLV